MFEIVVFSLYNKTVIRILDVVVEGIILPLISLIVFFIQIGMDAVDHANLDNIIFSLGVFFLVSVQVTILIIVMKFGAPHWTGGSAPPTAP